MPDKLRKYAVLYIEQKTGRQIEFTEQDFTLDQAVSAANAIAQSMWVERAWVEKRTYIFESMQTIHIVKH